MNDILISLNDEEYSQLETMFGSKKQIENHIYLNIKSLLKNNENKSDNNFIFENLKVDCDTIQDIDHLVLESVVIEGLEGEELIKEYLIRKKIVIENLDNIVDLLHQKDHHELNEQRIFASYGELVL